MTLRFSDSVTELAPALAAAQAAMSHAHRDRTNAHLGNSYATLAAVLDAVRPPLAEQGITVLHGHETIPGGPSLATSCRLLHKSGQWAESTIVLPVDKVNAQSFGSAATYGRRYTLIAICGISSEDDDDDGAGGNVPEKPTPKPKAPAKPKESEAERVARQDSHDPEWDADRAGFFARLKEIPGCSGKQGEEAVPTVVAKMKAGKRVSQIGHEAREKLLLFLASPKGQAALKDATPAEPGSAK